MILRKDAEVLNRSRHAVFSYSSFMRLRLEISAAGREELEKLQNVLNAEGQSSQAQKIRRALRILEVHQAKFGGEHTYALDLMENGVFEVIRNPVPLGGQ